MTSFKFTAIMALAMAESLFAINNVAVLELTHNASVRNEIKIEESRHLTDELRKQAVLNLPAKKYSVLTRDNIIALIPPDEKEAECLADGCAVSIGRAIGAEYVSQGAIGKFGKEFTISVELYETMSGKLLSSIVFESEDINGLLKAIRKEAGPLFQKILQQQKKKPSAIDVGADANTAPDAELDKSSFALPEWASAMSKTEWTGIGLVVAGLGFGAYGISLNSKYKSLSEDYLNAADKSEESLKKIKDAKNSRNLYYALGGALLAGGITVYFFF